MSYFQFSISVFLNT